MDADICHLVLDSCILSAMKLIKWYLDGISENGEAMVAYSAQLQFKRKNIGYSATLSISENGNVESRYWLQASTLEQDGTYCRWQSPENAVAAHWQATSNAQTSAVQLWSASRGHVKWHNILPRAAVDVCGQGISFQGHGYVECLQMTLPPWQLPLQRLRWGRFANEHLSVCWIEWGLRDQQWLRWMYVDGRPVEIVCFDDDRLRWRDGELLITGETRGIRNGYLRDTVLSKPDWLRQLLPDKAGGIHEDKYLARGAVHLENGQTQQGWVIDETVLFP
jgi:hypothetical protein